MNIHTIFEDPKKSRILKKAAYAVMGLFIIIDLVMPRRHEAFFWDKLPGFSSVYGLISTIAIIVVSKFIGRQCGIMKKEDYYD